MLALYGQNCPACSQAQALKCGQYCMFLLVWNLWYAILCTHIHAHAYTYPAPLQLFLCICSHRSSRGSLRSVWREFGVPQCTEHSGLLRYSVRVPLWRTGGVTLYTYCNTDNTPSYNAFIAIILCVYFVFWHTKAATILSSREVCRLSLVTCPGHCHAVPFGNHGCSCGDINSAYMYIIDNDGVNTWSSYGYRSKVRKELSL